MNLAVASLAFVVVSVVVPINAGEVPAGDAPTKPPAGPSFVAIDAKTPATLSADGKTISVSRTGSIVVQGATHDAFTKDGVDANRIAAAAAVVASKDDVIVFVDSLVRVERNGVKGVERDDVIAVAFDKSGKRLWRQRLRNASGDPSRDLFITDGLIILRERDGVQAIDRKDGHLAWVFDNDPMESVLNDLQIERAIFDGETLSLACRYQLTTGDGRTRFNIDLDSKTGERVFRKNAYVKPLPRPLYTRPEFRLEYPSDRAPPEVPTDFDGVRLHYTTLAWSKTAGVGIIINPLKSDLKAILDVARAARAKGSDGKLKPIQWLYVIDGAAVSATTVPVPYPARPKEAVIQIGHNDVLNDSGEVVVADEVARALNATALTGVLTSTSLPTAAGPLLFARDPDAVFNGSNPEQLKAKLFIAWGPYVFEENFRGRWPQLPY